MNDSSFNYTVYNKATGAYIKNLEMPDIENAKLNVASDEILVEGFHKPDTKCVNNKIVTISNPEKNSDARATSVLTKTEFINKLLERNLISPSEIVSNSLEFIPAYKDMSGYEKDITLIRWSGMFNVMRIDPLIESFGDEMLDDIFEVGV